MGRTIQINEATAGAREVNLILVDDGDGKTPITSVTWAAGDVRIKKQGGAWANAAGSDPAHTEDGVWTYTLTAGEVDTAGEVLVKAEKGSTFRMFTRTVEIVGYQPRDGVRLGLTALPNAAAEAAGGLYTRGTGAGQINQPANGRVDTNTVAMAADVISGAALSTGAANEIQNGLASSTAINLLAADVAALQLDVDGLATAAALAAVQADTDNIQTRLPAALVSGRMDSSVGAAAANTITASALATDAVTEIQSGLSTAAALAAVQSDVDAMQADVDLLATASALASVASSISGLATSSEVTALTADIAAVSDDVWDEALSGHLTAGSMGQALFLAKGMAQCNYVLDQTTFDAAGMLTSGRIRIFANAAAATSATQGGSGQGEVAAFLISASGSTPGQLQLYKVVQQ